jgi:D-alanyl-D-alanine carboxypeptidase/D-alanyl-D-alanine-endopeptidase (penicillin-binding protein 4)
LAIAVLACSAADPGVRCSPIRANWARAEPAPPAETGTDATAAQRAIADLSARVAKLGGTVGASVVSLPDRRTLAEVRADDAMNPASNAKLGTVAAALALLGPEHRFVTGLYGQASGGKVSQLVLRSHGDPTLTTDHLGGLARELRLAGVTEVGRILVDQSYFDERYVPPAFDQQPNEWAAFRAPVAAVSVERNTLTFWLRPGERDGDAVRIAVTPPGFAEVEGTLKTLPPDRPEKIGLELSARGDRVAARWSGGIPRKAKLVPVTRRVDDPRRLGGYALKAVLEEQGVRVAGEVALGGGSEKNALAVRVSEPLAEIVNSLGKDSDNFTAEMLFRAVGAAEEKSPTYEAAVRAVESVLKQRGAFPAGTKVVNGSGLFDANRATARGTTALLASCAADARIGPEFIAHLAVGGVDGTLKSRFRQWRKERAIRAKTGTLAKAVALSGYVMGSGGRPGVAFSILVEVPPGKTREARDAVDEAVDAVARSARP